MSYYGNYKLRTSPRIARLNVYNPIPITSSSLIRNQQEWIGELCTQSKSQEVLIHNLAKQMKYFILTFDPNQVSSVEHLSNSAIGKYLPISASDVTMRKETLDILNEN